MDAGVNVSYISALENSTANPSLELIERLAEALDVQFTEFFKAPSKNERPPKPLPKGRKRR